MKKMQDAIKTFITCSCTCTFRDIKVICNFTQSNSAAHIPLSLSLKHIKGEADSIHVRVPNFKSFCQLQQEKNNQQL